MVIRNNVAGLRAYNANRKTVGSIKKNLEKLSSGYRINRAADDAAGLGVSQRILAKVTELDRCENNALEGVDLARTADAALQEVNDMLKRARSLCIQAENGTYSDQELKAISEEMNQIFSEIDRISAGSYHNSICLFRNEVEPDFHYEYDEDFTPVGDDLQLWGHIDTIEEGPFDPAVKATPAKVTFKLDDSIDFNNVNTLEGKSITIGGVTYQFKTGADRYLYSSTRVEVELSGKTTESALKALTTKPYLGDNSTFVSTAVSVDKDARTVTLTAPLSDLSEKVEADGHTYNFVAPNGRADLANGVVVKNPMDGKPIMQVDGSGSTNNKPVYGTNLTCTFSLGVTDADLNDQTKVDNLKRNSLKVGGLEIALNSIVTKGMTKDGLGSEIVTEINKTSGYTASYSAGKLTVSYTSSASAQYAYVEEKTVSGTGGGYTTDPDPNHTWKSQALGINVAVTTPVSGERGEVTTITVPTSPTVPFSFYADGTNYLFYDSTKNQLTNAEYNILNTSPYVSSSNCIDTKGMSQQAIQDAVINRIKGSISGGSVAVNGNQITVTCNTIGTEMNLSSKIRGTAVTVTPEKYTPSSGGSTAGLGIGSTKYFTQDVTIPFSLGNTYDKDALIGRGFTIGSSSFEFVNGTSSGLSTTYTDIDISACADFSSLATKVQTVIQSRLGTSYTASIDANGKLEIKLKRSTSTSSVIQVIDGKEGITDGSQVKFEGGINTGHSQKAIDFSGITEENLDSLLGKGFRINCATCEGEYINVLFCWSRNPDMPDQFQRLDEGTGEMRTIHNIPVELSKITSADKIVQSIVEQVRPQLQHYTDVAVDENNPTVLLATEKRVGDVKVNNVLKLGSVESGVETNFIYSVTLQKVIDPPEPRTLKESEVNIYVGSDPEAQYIPIHLPYIDLKQLRLCPPELVDLTAADQDPADWLQRVDDADIAISSARGTIGADYNRLEHAVQDLSNSHIQLSDAYSVIRDTDMAELMMKQVKDQILVQTQQSMLAQANQMPQGVLQLLQ